VISKHNWRRWGGSSRFCAAKRKVLGAPGSRSTPGTPPTAVKTAGTLEGIAASIGSVGDGAMIRTYGWPSAWWREQAHLPDEDLKVQVVLIKSRRW